MELEIAAPTESVWSALSTAEGFERWFAPRAELEPRPGGELTWRWNEFFEWKQTVEVWEPGKRLMTRYDSAVDDGQEGKRPLFVDFRLEARGAGRTTLRLVHSGFGPEADFDEEYEGISHGWPIELRSLKLYLENHLGAERRVTWCTAPVEVSAEEAWTRLAGPRGLGIGTRYDHAVEGDPFTIPAASGETLEGTVLHVTPQELCGKVTSHGDAFLRLTADRCGGTTHVWLWLATYRPLEGVDLEGLQSHWNALLADLFPTRVDPATVQPERATATRES